MTNGRHPAKGGGGLSGYTGATAAVSSGPAPLLVPCGRTGPGSTNAWRSPQPDDASSRPGRGGAVAAVGEAAAVPALMFADVAAPLLEEEGHGGTTVREAASGCSVGVTCAAATDRPAKVVVAPAVTLPNVGKGRVLDNVMLHGRGSSR